MSPVIFSSGRADELEGAQVVEEPPHALGGVLRRHVVGGRDLADDLLERLLLLQPAPDERARLVQLEVLLRVEIDEDALARVELCEDHVLVRQQAGSAHHLYDSPVELVRSRRRGRRRYEFYAGATRPVRPAASASSR